MTTGFLELQKLIGKIFNVSKDTITKMNDNINKHKQQEVSNMTNKKWITDKNKEQVEKVINELNLDFLFSKYFTNVDRDYKQYESRILSTVRSRRYLEFWKQLSTSGQSFRSTDHFKLQMLQVTNLIQKGDLHLKYQTYDRLTGQLIGFFDMSDLYSGVSVGGQSFRINDVVTVLVLSTSSSNVKQNIDTGDIPGLSAQPGETSKDLRQKQKWSDTYQIFK